MAKTTTDTDETSSRRRLQVNRGWVQAATLVAAVGFFVLVLMGFLTYQSRPPIPDRVVTASGQEVFTGDDIHAGQDVFLRYGLMEYGSIFGHGAYLGPDYTADYLHRAAERVTDIYGGPGSQSAIQRTQQDFKTNTYDAATNTLTVSDAQATAYRDLVPVYAAQFRDPKGDNGLRPESITNPTEIRQITAYFSWSAWSAAANRVGKNYSYTNNWPPERLVGNGPSADVVLWSALSLIALLAGTGALFAAFGRWNWLGWRGREKTELRFREPQTVALTKSQRATAFFWLTMTALFLVQTIVGGAAAHYRADPKSFFGIDIASWFPFNLMRTWHVQLALIWVVTSFLAAGIFLVPMITKRRDSKGQTALTYLLLGALLIVGVGSLLGELAGQHGWFGGLWHWFGDQGFEYLDLGKFWQIGLTVGMALWVAILFLGLRGRLGTESRGNLPWLFFFSALALPLVYAVGLAAEHSDTFAITDYWRFMVVHLWVEDFLELFTTVMVAYIFVLLGVVRERVAMIVIFLDIVLYSVGGVIGTAHHWYFNGSPAAVLALGAFFSAMEVIPLTFLTLEAWSFIRLGERQQAAGAQHFPHRWAVMFLIAVGFWNFLGAGVFGFLINLPIVSYYEIGTNLTANHGHASMMGVYGMLACGFAVFALRYLVPPEKWRDRWLRISFWSLNIGLAWMVFASLLPTGIAQLYQSVNDGYWSARSFNYITTGTSALLEWLRLPGDILFIVGGVLPLLWLALQGVLAVIRRRGRAEPDRESDLQLFTEVGDHIPEEATAAGALTHTGG